jgi:hypothetical protein
MLHRFVLSSLAVILLFASSSKAISESHPNKPLTPGELRRSRLRPPPVNYREKIKALFDAQLSDAKSSTYEFEQPRAEKVWRGLVRGGYKYYWVVRFHLNTKMPNGIFTGPMPCEAIFDEKGRLQVNRTKLRESVKKAKSRLKSPET